MRTGAALQPSEDMRMNIPSKLMATAVLLAGAAQAHAGCGLTVTFDNDLNVPIKVLVVEAKTTTGTWDPVYSTDFSVAAGKKATKAIETDAGCALPHHLRVKYEKGSNTLYKTKGPLATAIDKKITIEFND